jgi:hypothetical protein
MKTRADEYFFSRQEIEILKEISKENCTVSQIRKNLRIKPSLLSQYLTKLQEKRIIFIKQRNLAETSDDNSRKSFFFQETPHAFLIKDLLKKYAHIKWEDLLSGRGIDVLFQISTGCPTIRESMSRVTFWRYSMNLMSLGIVIGYGDNLKINERFDLLRSFLEEYQIHVIRTIIDSLSAKAVILWRKDFECLIRVPNTLKIAQKGFTKTATSSMQDYGIQLISDSDVYSFSKRKTGIRLEDVILHTLLIESGNVRNTIYALLLLKKEFNQVNKSYLLKLAIWYDVGLQINAMLEFLRTRGNHTGAGLPTWQEFVQKAMEYTVDVD